MFLLRRIREKFFMFLLVTIFIFAMYIWQNERKPKYAIGTKGEIDTHQNFHVMAILEHFGYRRTSVNGDWDLLWSIEYPFKWLEKNLNNLKCYQKVNHWPISNIANKADFSKAGLPFLPKAFTLPTEKEKFIKYAKENPQALFVQKFNAHRHIEIKLPSEIDFNNKKHFIQEFIQNPFLIDGHKFDIGIYTVITSIDPLRIYIYSGNVLIRFCPEEYHPLDIKIVRKYIVGDEYLCAEDVPSLKKYYEKFSSNIRESFNAYLREKLIDPNVIWNQTEEIIRETFLSHENLIVRKLKSYNKLQFFELVRFDFFVDENLRLLLMEVNMTPSLSSKYNKRNTIMYEQLLVSVFHLVGIVPPVKKTFKRECIPDTLTSTVSDLVTQVDLCVKNECDQDHSCNSSECQLCLPCLNERKIEILKNAFREHLNKMNMKRIFPKPILNLEKFDIAKEIQNLSTNDGWMTRWFYGKCLIERSWCQ